MIDQVALGCFVVILLCMGLNIVRVVIGPTMADRAVAADGIFMNLVGIVVVYSIFLKSSYYFDLVLVFSLLGFVGTVCFAKFLQRGKLIE